MLRNEFTQYVAGHRKAHLTWGSLEFISIYLFTSYSA